MKPKTLPDGWPENVKFCPLPIPGKGLLPELQWALEKRLEKYRSQTQHSNHDNHSKYINNSVRIKKINDPNHPAFQEYGLFANRKFAPREHIIDYCGLVTSSGHESKESNYTLSLNENVVIDAELTGNEARFVNDFRGVAEKPNVIFQSRVDEAGLEVMAFYVGHKEIKKGEEFLVSYGKGFWRERGVEFPKYENFFF